MLAKRTCTRAVDCRLSRRPTSRSVRGARAGVPLICDRAQVVLRRRQEALLPCPIFPTVRPCLRADSWVDVSPHRIRSTRIALRLALQLWMFLGSSSAIGTRLLKHTENMSSGWTQRQGEQDRPSMSRRTVLGLAGCTLPVGDVVLSPGARRCPRPGSGCGRRVLERPASNSATRIVSVVETVAIVVSHSQSACVYARRA
jgi:hypothetical protein